MQRFVDAKGRTIRDGAKVYFTGKFPKELPILEPGYYAEYGNKHARRGWVHIIGNRLLFVTVVGNKLMSTGLGWELDDEPCHDLILI